MSRTGKIRTLTLEEGLAASTLTFREAASKYGIGYPSWRALREGKGYLPFKGTGLAEDAVARVLESVRTLPHLNTQVRSRQLGVGTSALQAFLADRGLSKLNGRLRYAGYQVEACRPLEVARLRRIVASRPGGLTHIDYKTFGFLRGVHGEPQVRIGGFVVIDSLTSWAACYLAKTGDADEATKAFHYYLEAAPFELFGMLLSDNGLSFLADQFTNAVRRAGLQHRTIRPSHPWSNGKVEAMNKTLKYQCFAAIAGNISGWEETVVLVEKWMRYYNEVRAHGGHTNKGLPPKAFYDLWKNTPGDDISKLITLGILKIGDEWDTRLMGSNKPHVDGEEGPLPWAFVCERRMPPSPSLAVQLGIPDGSVPMKNVSGIGSNFTPAR